MSWPQGGGVITNITIPADEALRLADEIYRVLGLVHKFQEAEIANGTERELYDAPDEIEIEQYVRPSSLRAMLDRIQVVKGVNLGIIPDRRSPGSSAYGYYTTPEYLRAQREARLAKQK